MQKIKSKVKRKMLEGISNIISDELYKYKAAGIMHRDINTTFDNIGKKIKSLFEDF